MLTTIELIVFIAMLPLALISLRFLVSLACIPRFKAGLRERLRFFRTSSRALHPAWLLLGGLLLIIPTVALFELSDPAFAAQTLCCLRKDSLLKLITLQRPIALVVHLYGLFS